MVLVLAFTLIPVAGVADQALVGVLSVTLAVGVVVGGAVNAVSHALFPDPPASTRERRPPSRQAMSPPAGSRCVPR